MSVGDGYEVAVFLRSVEDEDGSETGVDGGDEKVCLAVEGWYDGGVCRGRLILYI